MKHFKALFLLAGLALAGCSAQQGPVSIRSGLGSEANLDAIRPPSGATYNFILTNDAAPVPATMSITSRKRSGNRYTYNGQMVLTLPEAENLEEIASLIAEALGKTTVSARGNQLFIPVGLTADNRFRSSRSNITSDVTRYAPHDCFAVLGTCRYRAIDQLGRVAELVTETTETDGVWRSKTELDPKAKNVGLVNETRRAVYSIDKNAVLLDMVVTRGSGAQRTRFAIRRK
ncbi:hypothetical protein BCF46_0985 [Litoreibacter meonggei]|uniref:Group 4 capsule polysaccharide lipoprotein GfcB/YjbF n=1 Tax=Litoreibacter meonggei TaxID=1049199 RepID=A0A497WT40_9RHOB|nr:hypothetical protein [Litoreibacter meonggei]RLJ58847.1 hypothetical protein BCF46_0985 [Litoreibacter meonggei]